MEKVESRILENAEQKIEILERKGQMIGTGVQLNALKKFNMKSI